MVKNLPVMQEMQVQSLGWEDLLEEKIGNPLQYSCLENPMDRGAWWVQSLGSQRVGHDQRDGACLHFVGDGAMQRQTPTVSLWRAALLGGSQDKESIGHRSAEVEAGSQVRSSLPFLPEPPTPPH